MPATSTYRRQQRAVAELVDDRVAVRTWISATTDLTALVGRRVRVDDGAGIVGRFTALRHCRVFGNAAWTQRFVGGTFVAEASATRAGGVTDLALPYGTGITIL
jgi:type 1 glutamine amidotransferase